MRGIAHISFVGGGVFLPARNPYDRQVLVEHVADHVRSKGEVQVALDDRCWSVCMTDTGTSCSSCGRSLHSVCHSPASGLAAYCVRCAFSMSDD